MHSRNEVRASLGLLLIVSCASSLALGCGGGSNSEVATGGQSSNGGSPSGGSATSGGDTSAGKGGTGVAGSTTTEGGSPDMPQGGEGPVMGGTCAARDKWTEAIHYALQVTWPATTAGDKGTGKIDIWSRLTYSASGNALDMGVHACGSVLPETNLTIAGKLATGGDKVLIDVPEKVWDAPSIPITMAKGTQSSFDVGSSVGFSYVSLLGPTLPSPTAAWPESGTDMTVTDLDGDGSKGYTAVPRSGGGYVLPPTAIGLGGSAPAADKVYLVSREAMTLKGKRTSCDAHSGTADVTSFDSHVVGCHVKGGDDCDAKQGDFVDQNRMHYVVSSATYEAKVVPDAASCADVRAALPAK